MVSLKYSKRLTLNACIPFLVEFRSCFERQTFPAWNRCTLPLPPVIPWRSSSNPIPVKQRCRPILLIVLVRSYCWADVLVSESTLANMFDGCSFMWTWPRAYSNPKAWVQTSEAQPPAVSSDWCQALITGHICQPRSGGDKPKKKAPTGRRAGGHAKHMEGWQDFVLLKSRMNIFLRTVLGPENHTEIGARQFWVATEVKFENHWRLGAPNLWMDPQPLPSSHGGSNSGPYTWALAVPWLLVGSPGWSNFIQHSWKEGTKDKVLDIACVTILGYV